MLLSGHRGHWNGEEPDHSDFRIGCLHRHFPDAKWEAVPHLHSHPPQTQPPAHILLSSTQYLISKLPGLSLLSNVGYCEPCLGKAAKSLGGFRLVKHGGHGPGPGTTKPTIANGLQGTLNPQYSLSLYFGWFYFDLS